MEEKGNEGKEKYRKLEGKSAKEREKSRGLGEESNERTERGGKHEDTKEKERCGEYESKEEREKCRKPTVCERRIWKFYEWAVVLAPIMLMLSHWYIFYVFSQNNHELLEYSEANEVCIAWIYTILYLYVPLMLLPASYFFRWCNLFRVPFVYFIFINVERWYYGAWFCTNEMVDTHYILIGCIICIYAVEIVGLILKYGREIMMYGKFLLPWGVRKMKDLFYGRYRKGKKDKGRRGHLKVVEMLGGKGNDEVERDVSMQCS